MHNPFTERGRILDPTHFAGRWGEMSLILERLEAGRPVFLTGGPGIGTSSLLTHLTQSVAVALDIASLRAYYLDLADAPDEAAVYQVVTEALGGRGSTVAALEVALVTFQRPVLLCLDNAHVILAKDWGTHLLEVLARIVRAGQLMLVVGAHGAPPLLSEPYAFMTLGAMATTEARLIADAYLDESDIQFTQDEVRLLAGLSAMHPTYFQRAAYHLFEHKRQTSYQWIAAYLAEARERPVPGAPLPAHIFEGDATERFGGSAVEDSTTTMRAHPIYATSEMDMSAIVLLFLILGTALLVYSVFRSIVLVGVAVVLCIAVFLVFQRRATRKS